MFRIYAQKLNIKKLRIYHLLNTNETLTLFSKRPEKYPQITQWGLNVTTVAQFIFLMYNLKHFGIKQFF